MLLAFLCQFWYGHLLRSAGLFSEVRPGDLKPPKGLQASPLAMSPFSPARPREPHGYSNSRYTFLTPSPREDLRRWCANVDALSIAYAFRPQLRSRLTLGGIALPRKL